MDPQTLPDDQREIYNRIRQRYKVAFEPLRLQRGMLHLLRPTDLEALLGGRDPLQNVSEFPFWTRLWEAAMVLAHLLAGLPDAQGGTLLELGAGLGAPGIAAATRGFRVTLTDYEEQILDFQRVSCGANGLTNVEFQLVDWLNPPAMERYDVICGAEILFREEFFDPLLALLQKTLKPDGVIYLAHDARRRSLPSFLSRAEGQYTIETIRKTLKSEDGERVILLNRLRPAS